MSRGPQSSAIGSGREGVEVLSLGSTPGGGFELRTSAGGLRADRVVLATGAYQSPHRPAGAGTLPPHLLQIDVDGFRDPGALPPGRVLVVGSDQSGCQISEELREAGRDVVLSCGRAPWAPRRVGGRDIFWWVVESGFMDRPVAALPTPAERLVANVASTGHGSGHDLHLRTLRAMGVTLSGHFLGAMDGRLQFAPDLGESVAWGDERHRRLMDLVRNVVAERGLPPIEIPDPRPFDPRAPEELGLTGFGAVIFAGGFRPAYRKWLPWPDAFDDLDFPIQRDGARTVVDGLYFMGVHFLRKRKSSLLFGVGEDAAIVAGAIAERPRSKARGPRAATHP